MDRQRHGWNGTKIVVMWQALYMVTVAKLVGWNCIKFVFFKPFIAFLMYSVTSDKRKLNKPDRCGHQNIKTKINSFFSHFRILYMFSHRIFAHSNSHFIRDSISHFRTSHFIRLLIFPVRARCGLVGLKIVIHEIYQNLRNPVSHCLLIGL